MKRAGRPLLEDDAAISIGFLAADFVIQPETFPVFKRWCEKHSLTPIPDRESLKPLVKNLERRVDGLHGQLNSGGDL